MKRVWLIIGSSVLVLIGVITVTKDSAAEPTWQGRTVSNWLLGYDYRGTGVDYSAVDAAFRHFGTNALHVLMREIVIKHSPIRWQTVQTLRRVRIYIDYTAADDRRDRARRAFATLGRTAAPILPQLREHLNDPELHEDVQEAVEAILQDSKKSKRT